MGGGGGGGFGFGLLLIFASIKTSHNALSDTWGLDQIGF